MGKNGRPKSRLRRWTGRLALLCLAGCAVAAGWNYVRPLLAEGTITTYESYPVETGSVETSMSFSASISLVNSETFTAGASTTVREIFVTESQAVAAGDKLIQLANGEIYYASFDGMVNEIRVAQGDWVRSNGTLMQVCDIDHLQMSMNVDEYDISKLSVNQNCTVTVMSLGLSFETEIAHISRVSASNGSVAYYTVTALIDAPDNVLPGMQATVSIPGDRVENVPIVSMNALAFEEDNTPYVLIPNEQGGYDHLKVAIGLNDGMNVQIISGLNAGDTAWAVSGTESLEPAFSLEGLYKQLVGETVVINDQSGGGRSQRQGESGTEPYGLENFTPGELPEGMEGFTPGELPEGMEDFTPGELPEGMEGFTPGQLPEGMEGFTPGELPEGMEGFAPGELPEGGDQAAEPAENSGGDQSENDQGREEPDGGDNGALSIPKQRKEGNADE